MKKDTFYTLRKQSPWLTVSGVMMGVAFLIHAIYYLMVRSIAQVHIAELLIFMILPMTVELFWCLLIHVFPLKTTTPLGVMSCLAFLVLLIHALFYNNILRTILDTAIFLAAAQLVMVILCGRFPYKLFGSAAMLASVCVRAVLFTYPTYIHHGRWEDLITREIPGLCILIAMYCVFGALEPHKREVTQKPLRPMPAEKQPSAAEVSE